MGKHNINGRYDEAEAKYISNTNRLDDNQSMFLARELSYIRTQVLETKKAPLNAFNIFPVMTDVPAGAETAIQREYDSVGMAEIISNYADDLKRVDVVAKETPVKVVTLGDSYGYNVVEVQNAQFAGMNLDARKAMAARRAIDLKLNKLAWFGDAVHGIKGFLGNTNITSVSLPADGTGSSTKFADKTADKVVRDINSVINAVGSATNYVEQANTVVIAPNVFAYIASTPFSTESGITILDYVKKAHPEIIRWESAGELVGAGTSNTDVIVAGNFDPEYIRFEIPMRFNQLPVENRNLEFVVNCMSRAIGVTINYPLAFAKAQGC